MNVSLVLVREDGRQQDVALKKAAQVIGRSTDCALRIPNASVSRHHCEVHIGDAKASIRDLGSSNGTYVNRKRVTQASLSPGDLVSIGEFVFVVRVDGEPTTVDAEEAYDEGIVIPVKTAAQGPVAPGAKAASKPASPLDDDDELLAGASPANDESSVADFDFLDEDEDLKKQPKL